MNILRVMDSASTLFSKKTTVILIHAESREVINTHVINNFLLPEEFNKPTILEIVDTCWRVVKVGNYIPGSYFRVPKISLYVTHQDTPLAENTFLVPTKAVFDEAYIKCATPSFNDFILSLTNDEWLQLEFVPLENINLIQETTSIIETIINSPDEHNHLLGYSNCQVRMPAHNSQLKIPFDNFCSFINIKEKGSILGPQNAIIEHGFSLKSENHIYYGVTKKGIISKLAMKGFDCIDDELSDLLTKYKLAFVDWCNASILS